MNNKKIKIIITVAILIVVFILMYAAVAHKLFWKNVPNGADKKVDQTAETPKTELPKVDCGGYAVDQDAYKEAIGEPNVNICECVKNAKLRDTCKSVAMDASFYSQALKQFDPSLCDRILDSSRQEACVAVVQGGIAELTKSDPQYLANIYAAAHNEAAVTEYENLLQKDPNNVDNLVALSLAYSEKGLSAQGQGQDQMPYVEKALTAAQKAEAINPNSTDAYRAEGYAYEIKPDYNNAVAAYSKAISINPKDFLAYAGRGHVERMLGFLQPAVNDFTRAAEFDTTQSDIFIYTNLCNLEFSRSNMDAAIKNCTIVTDKKNADPVFQSEAYQTMATILMQNKKNAQAKNYLLTAKTLTPNDPNLYISLAKLGIFQTDYAGAEANARKSIELSPEKAASYLILSQSLYMEEKYQDSITAAQKGLTLVAKDVSLLAPSKPPVARDLNYSIANSYKQLGDTTNQKKYEQQAVAAFNNSN